jgi:glycosyltransferase involved in cell wall biosynthesis
VVERANGFPAPREPQPGRLRREAGIGDDELLVLYVGRIAAGKGIEWLLAAAREAADAHFVFVGPDDGHGVAALLHDAAARNPRIHALGPRADTAGLYGDADLFVLPSEGESFGMVAAEAASAGVPVVVTDRCGIAEFLNEAALVVEAGAESVTQAVVAALADPLLRERLGEAGRDAAARNSWEAIVQRQEALYAVAR